MKKKVIILGSDLGTLDMAIEAKKMGLYVIVTDLMETSPTKEVADEAWMISTTDIDSLERKCIEENIVGVITGASDFNTTNSRNLCKRLNLPVYCDSDYSWKVTRDKSEFKKICKKVGAPVATDYYISEKFTDEELEKIKFPVVVKPVDSSGNRGVSYCNNIEELEKAYKYARSVSNNSNIIVERQLNGPEWEANYVIADGEARLLYFNKYSNQPGESPNLYSLMSTTSYKLKQFLDEMNDKLIRVFKEADFKDGVVWVETILDSDGHFYLIECGYRYSAGMNYTLYEKINKFNTIKWMIDISLGLKHTKENLPESLNKNHRDISVTYFLFSSKEDVIAEIKGIDKLQKMGNFIIDIPKRVGSFFRYNSCIGTIRFYAINENDMINILKKINEVLEINNEYGENMFIHFTDYDNVKKDFECELIDFL